MLLGTGPHVLHVQFQSVLNAIDTFVLSSMIHKGSLDVRCQGDDCDIGDKNHQSDHALQQCNQRLRINHLAKKA